MYFYHLKLLPAIAMEDRAAGARNPSDTVLESCSSITLEDVADLPNVPYYIWEITLG